MRPKRMLVLSLFLILFAGMTWAQGTTGTLTGNVTADGAALPGALVTISSPAMQGSRTTVTAANGSYNFSGIPPGTYTVTFELEGMSKVTKNVVVRLSQVERADAELQVGSLAETIIVSAEAPSVLETTTVSRTITSEVIDDLPVGRTVVDTVLLSPGVNSRGVNNQVTISGAPSYDNLFLINGTVVNENLRGQPENLFIEDAIQETTVFTGAVSAEYGRFTGGVVSAITKSGGNEFSGSFRSSMTNPDWRNKTPWETESDHLDKISYVYEATLGGRILRDKLWFFGAGRQFENTIQRYTSFTNIPYVFSEDEKRYEVKLTGQVTPKHSVVASWLDIARDQNNQGFLNIIDLDTVTYRSLPNDLLSVNYNGIFGSNLLFEANYSERNFTFKNSGGKDTSPVGGTWLYDLSRAVFANAPVFCAVCGGANYKGEERNSDTFVAKATYFLATAMGTHNIVGGIEDYAETRKSNNFQSASQFEIYIGGGTVVGQDFFPRFDTGTTFRYRPIFEISPGTDFQTQSAFINDRWDINKHWNVNIGLRYDKNDGNDASGNLVSNDSAFSPRIGVIYDVLGDGRHRINLSFGTYVSKISDGNVGGSAQAAGNPSLFSWTYRGTPINPTGTPNDQLIPRRAALQMVFDWFNSIGGTSNRNPSDGYIGSFISGYGTAFPASISSPAADEISLGYGLQIGQSGFVRVDAIRREWKNFYAGRIDMTTGRKTDPEGAQSDLSWTVNEDSETERDYKGIQLYGTWRPGRFSVGGGYTWSELKGNDEGEGAGTATIRNTPLSLWYPEYLGYADRRPYGFLPQDQTHRARVWVGYDLPLGAFGNLNFSLLQRYDSGMSYSASGNIDASGRVVTFPNVPTNPGYVLNQLGTSHTYYFSERGAYRAEDEYNTDLAINYEVPIKFVSLFINTEVLNVFDQDAVVNPNSSVRTRRNNGAASGLIAFNPYTPASSLIECPQGAAASECAAMGAHWQKGTQFGQATGVGSYQIPLEYRFSVGLRF